MRRGLILAAVGSVLALAIQAHTNRPPLGRYDRYVLPGFDAYAYMAMADAPAFFTLPPWGFRILTPWLVHSLPVGTSDSFRLVTSGALALSGVLLFAFLRRLGYAEWASLLTAFLCLLTRPVAENVQFRFLTDPVCLSLELVLLLLLESSGDGALLGLIAVLGALAKEEFLLFLPVIYFARRDRDGDLRAMGKAVWASIPALAVSLILRQWWAPQTHASAGVGRDVFWIAVYRVLEGWPEWWGALLVNGLAPLALLGALLPETRAFLKRYGYLLAVTVGVAFAASVYTDNTELVPFFAPDIPRLLVYALPLLAPLALAVAHRVYPLREGEVARIPASPRLGPPAVLLTLLLALLPLATQDRYRRVDLQGRRDGRLVLALCRESLAFASRLTKGKQVVYHPEERTFLAVRADPHGLERMRWFLWEGWGHRPQYGSGPVVMGDRRAVILVPCFRPADWNLILSASAPGEMSLLLLMNGRSLGEVSLGPLTTKHKVRIPGEALFRGDNLLELQAVGPADLRARLRELALRPLS
jgi:hypothetical protein